MSRPGALDEPSVVACGALRSRIDCDRSGTIALSAELERDLGIHPLDLVVAVLDVEEKTGADLPVEELTEVKTLGQFLSFVSRAR